jgi:hypothetical protein
MTNSTLVFHAAGKDYALDFQTPEEAAAWFNRLDPQDASLATKVTPEEAAKLLDLDEYDDMDDTDYDETEDAADGEI